MNVAQWSCFAWTIYSAKMLWQGKGAVPEPSYEDTHSTRSKDFGILTILWFLIQYLARFPSTYRMAHPIMVYCDNCSIIQWLKHAEINSAPKDTLCDDYYIVQAIQDTLAQLQPLSIKFEHIHRHQDKKVLVHLLPLSTQLNIKCNKRANSMLPWLQNQSIFLSHCMLTGSLLHLAIQGKLVVRELMEAIRHVVTTPKYREYLQKKFQWTTEDSTKVNWNAFKMALQYFTPTDQSKLHIYLHEWLPLCTAPCQGNTSPELKVCPSCHCKDKYHWHFLECDSTQSMQLFNILLANLESLHKKHNVAKPLAQLLHASMIAIKTDQLMPKAESHFTEIQDLYNKQANIGWEQLF